MRKITKEIFNLLEGSDERVEYDDEVLQYLYDETTYDIDRYGKVQHINFLIIIILMIILWKNWNGVNY